MIYTKKETIQIALVLVLAIFMNIMLSACHSRSSSNTIDEESFMQIKFDGPWGDNLSQLQSKYKSDETIRSIIADGKITNDEIVQLFEKQKECMKSNGYNIELSDINKPARGIVFIKSHSDAVAEIAPLEAMNICNNATGYNDLLLVNYGMHNDPDNKGNYTEQIANCLIKHGAKPSGYTKDNLLDDFKNNSGFINNFLMKNGTLSDSVYGNCVENPNE
ncbi:MAG: hypothetical protein LBI63_00750 [Candidatus Ancillula sp.]|nr:hypothetical protein [Candidatus Ancillula sp.]